MLYLWNHVSADDIDHGWRYRGGVRTNVSKVPVRFNVWLLREVLTTEANFYCLSIIDCVPLIPTSSTAFLVLRIGSYLQVQLLGVLDTVVPAVDERSTNRLYRSRIMLFILERVRHNDL